MRIGCHRKSNTLCYYFILAAFIFSVFISIANFAKLKGSLIIRVLQYFVCDKFLFLFIITLSCATSNYVDTNKGQKITMKNGKHCEGFVLMLFLMVSVVLGPGVKYRSMANTFL